MKVDYNKQFEEISKTSNGKKLLLHACCAPCATTCLERTKTFKTDLFFYNPNIDGENEFVKRLNELVRFTNEVYGKEVKVIETKYNAQEFSNAINGLENEPERGKRCYICYKLRLEETAKYAKENGYDYFATTLTLSPHKNADWLNEIGFALGKEYGVKYLPTDFKKQNGYLNSIKLSEKHGLYRQNYCGCEFSKK